MLRGESYWADHQVALELDTAAKAVDLARKEVMLGDGRSVACDTLVFATGTRARDLPLPGIQLDGVLSLRKIDDVRRLRPALDAVRRVAIVGAGYIGLEVAAVLRQEDREAIVVEAEARVMKRVAGEEVSAFFERPAPLARRRHPARRWACGIDGEGRAAGSRSPPASRSRPTWCWSRPAPAPTTILPLPRASPARTASWWTTLPARAADIYAIGDCARFFSHRYGRKIRLECVQNAIDQAKAAAAAIIGKPAPLDPVPWFWSDQYEIKLQITGLLDGYDACETIGNPGDEDFRSSTARPAS